jgi:hypothetical protein
LASVVPLILTLMMRPHHIDPLLLAAIFLPILTIGALFLVPLTKWIGRRAMPRRRRRLSVHPAPS